MAPWTLKITGWDSPGRCAMRRGPCFRSMRDFETYTTSLMVIPFTAQESYPCAAIKSSFVLYRLGRTLLVDGQHLQLPGNRNGRWRVAYRLVASLILQLTGEGDGLPRSGQ